MNITALPVKDSLLLVVNGQRLAELGHAVAREMCDALGQQVRGTATQETGVARGSFALMFRRVPKQLDELEDMILCIANGRLVFDAPIRVAREIWRYLVGQQRLAEEWANADTIARDAAILARTGAPVGLTSHPQIQAEAKKIAEGDSDLRRYIPNASPRARVRNAPGVFHDTRTPAQVAAAILSTATGDERERLLARIH